MEVYLEGNLIVIKSCYPPDADEDKDCDELFLWDRWAGKRAYALYQAGTNVRDYHYCGSPTCREQGLNLRRIWVQTFFNEVVQ